MTKVMRKESQHQCQNDVLHFYALTWDWLQIPVQIKHLIRNLVICSLKWGPQPATPQQPCATYARGPVHFKLQYLQGSAVQTVFYLEDASPSSKN